MLPNRILPRFALFAAALVLALLSFFYAFEYFPLVERLQEQRLSDTAGALFTAARGDLLKAYDGNDDVALLRCFEGILRTKGVNAAYLLGAGGKVLIHTNTGQWGAVHADLPSRNAAAAAAPLLQYLKRENEYLFSAPLAPAALFCLRLSAREVRDASAFFVRKALYTSVIVLFLAVALFTAFGYFQVTSKTEKVRRMLSPGAAFDPTLLPSGEFGELARSIGSALERCRLDGDRLRDGAAASAAKLNALIETLASRVGEGLMVVDHENRVRYLNDGARTFFSVSGEARGRHVLDVVKIPAVLEMLKEFAGNGSGGERNINGAGVTVLGAGNGKEDFAGMLVMLRSTR